MLLQKQVQLAALSEIKKYAGRKHGVLHNLVLPKLGIAQVEARRKMWARARVGYIGQGPVLAHLSTRRAAPDPVVSSFLDANPKWDSHVNRGQVRRFTTKRDYQRVIFDKQPIAQIGCRMDTDTSLARKLGILGLDLPCDPKAWIPTYEASNPAAHPGVTAAKMGFRTKREADGFARNQAMAQWTAISEDGVPKLGLWGVATRSRMVDVGEEARSGERKSGRIVLMGECWEPALYGAIVAPLTQALKKTKGIVGLWVSQFRGRTEDLFEWLGRRGNEADGGRFEYVCGDLSSWDATLPAQVIQRACEVLVLGFKPGEDRDRAQKLMHHAALELCYGLITLPNGEIIRPAGQQKTGSAFTTLINCAANYIMQRCVARYVGFDSQYLRFLVYGDDSIVTNTRPDIKRFDIDEWTKAWTTLFGMTMKPAQTYVSRWIRGGEGRRGVEFLGYSMNAVCQPVKPLTKTIEQVWYPEKATVSDAQLLESVMAAVLVNPFNTEAVQFCEDLLVYVLLSDNRGGLGKSNGELFGWGDLKALRAGRGKLPYLFNYDLGLIGVRVSKKQVVCSRGGRTVVEGWGAVVKSVFSDTVYG